MSRPACAPVPPPPLGTRELHALPAPAKLNLFLHIIGRREDGYHLLQSVFALIDWCDRLDFEWRSDARISRQDGTLSPHASLPEHDLCVRAAQALQQHTGCTQGVHIRLDKHLPMEAGLGGGSSDAATTLIALNRLWDLRLSRPQLMAIAAELGADVPFFVFGHNAWVEGIGEQLRALSLPPRRVTVVKPSQGVSTAEIFRSPQLKRDTKPATMAGFAGSQGDGSPYAFGRNDLQALASLQCPSIETVVRWLESKGVAARMTGSGSAVFATHTETIDLTGAAPDWVVQSSCVMGAHPLADW